MTEPINKPPEGASISSPAGDPVGDAADHSETAAPVIGAPVTAGAPPAANRRLILTVAAIAVLVWVLDQGSKALAVHKLSDGHRVALIGDLFGLVLTRNAGAAFSMATGATWVLTVVALIVVVTIIRFARRLGSRGWTVALGLLLGGALGNLTDRLFRAPGFFRGHVIDFLEWPHWPIFNLADSCIVTAALLIALLSLRGIGIDGERVIAHPAAESSAESGE
jgi:signal peptidase II